MAYVKRTGRLKSALHHQASGKGGKDWRKECQRLRYRAGK